MWKTVIPLCAASSSATDASAVYIKQGVDLDTLAVFEKYYSHGKKQMAHLMQFMTTIPMITTEIENGA